MKLNDKTINFLCDAFDESAMLYYDDFVENNDEKLTYLEALTEVLKAFLDDTYNLKITDDSQNKIYDIFKNIESKVFNSEEIRKAFLILTIKGYKHSKFNLDTITPDMIGVIIANLIPSLKDTEKLTIFDPNYGSGNLLMTISNYLEDDVTIYGMENETVLAEYGLALANLMDREIHLFNQNALYYNLPEIDLVVSDLAVYEYYDDNYHSELYDKGIRYFPYLLIEKHIKSGNLNTKYIYIIDNNFFNMQGAIDFKNMLKSEIGIKALIVLPPNFFKKEPKALLILSKTKVTDSHVVILPTTSDEVNFVKALQEAKEHLKE